MPIRAFEDRLPAVDATAYVDPAAVVIGDVVVGRDSSLWPTAVARGDIQAIRIGVETNIQDGSVLHVTHDSGYCPGGLGVRVGDGVTVGHRAILHACTIEDGALIGMGSVIMDGAVVGARCLVGAGSLVPPGRRLEGGWLWLGSPVRRVRRLRREELEFLEYSARHYVTLKERHRQARPAT